MENIQNVASLWGEEGEGPRGVSERGEVRRSVSTVGEGTAAPVSLRCCSHSTSEKVTPLRQQLPASRQPLETLDLCLTCQLLMFELLLEKMLSRW